MKNPLPKINTNSLDDLFSTEEQRQDDQREKVIKIPIKEIHDFKNHPFHVKMDENMEQLIESIKENGILRPAVVRPRKMVVMKWYQDIEESLHLHKNGIETIDAIVRDLTDDQATIIMVDSNIQRENILPTERGFAYRMKLEAMKRQGNE